MKGWRWDIDDGAIGLCCTGVADSFADEYDATLMKRIEGGDFLATHVAEQWPTTGVQQKLLAEVRSSDPKAVRRALQILRDRPKVLEDGTLKPRTLPEGTADAVLHAIYRVLAAPGKDEGLAGALGEFVASVKMEEGARALIPLVNKMPPGQERRLVIRGVAVSYSPEATTALHGWLSDTDPWTQFEAASQLARRHDRAAIPVLLKWTEIRTGRPGDPLYELSYFPDSPEAVAAIQQAKRDPVFQDDAKRALKHMEEMGSVQFSAQS